MASIRQKSAPRFRRGAVDSYWNSLHSAFPFALASLVYWLLPTLVGLFQLPTLHLPLMDGTDNGPRLPKRRAMSSLDLLEMEDANNGMLGVAIECSCISLRRLRADAQEFLFRRSTMLLHGRRSESSPPPPESTSGNGVKGCIDFGIQIKCGGARAWIKNFLDLPCTMKQVITTLLA
jgi:hypothetical protein